MKTFALICALLGTSAAADTLALATVDAAGIPESTVRVVERTVERALQAESSWRYRAVAPLPTAGPLRGCAGDLPCLVARAQPLGADHAVLLELQPLARGLAVKAHLVDVVRAKVLTRAAALSKVEGSESELAELVARLIPPQARKGFGSLWVEAEPGATLKLNGRRQPLTSQGIEIPVTAGRHELDIGFKSGQAQLQSVDVEEGSRVRAQFAAAPFVAHAPARSSDTLRLTAYGLWSAAGLAFAASLTAGALSNYELRDRGVPCVGEDRTCSGLAEAQAHQRQAQVYARNANIFAGTGLVLAVGGAGVFAWDLFFSRRP